VWWLISIISATWAAEVGRIMAQSQRRQKVRFLYPISTNKLDDMLHICNPSYAGVIEGSQFLAKARPYLKTN
jgi:hypothetical protein